MRTCDVDGDLDVVRHASRFGLPQPGGNPNGVFVDQPQPDAELGLRRARALTLLMLGRPGSSYLYQGEELGLPEHTTLPNEARQDPVYFHTQGREAGRDGCRVPVPWRSTAPAFGFNDTGKSWLPQPDSFAHHAVDVEEQHPDSTLHMYRTALRFRRELGLGRGSVVWLPLGDQAVAFRNGATTVVVNAGLEPVPLPPHNRVLVASGPGVIDDQTLAANSAAWMS